MLGCGFHAIAHGGRKGVEANARVLQVEHQRVDAFQHIVGGRAFSGNSMLGAENGNELHSLRVGQDVDRAAPLRVDAGLIGDQPDMLPVKRREVHLLENVDTRLGRRHGCGGSHRILR